MACATTGVEITCGEDNEPIGTPINKSAAMIGQSMPFGQWGPEQVHDSDSLRLARVDGRTAWGYCAWAILDVTSCPVLASAPQLGMYDAAHQARDQQFPVPGHPHVLHLSSMQFWRVCWALLEILQGFRLFQAAAAMAYSNLPLRQILSYLFDWVLVMYDTFLARLTIWLMYDLA